MKRSGLKNRFDQENLKSVWTFHVECFWCGKSGFDCFHHVKSSSSSDYKKGKFNSSILNACPIHNHICHLYNPKLHKIENEKKLLVRILKYLLKVNYQFNEMDKEFLRKYKKNYIS